MIICKCVEKNRDKYGNILSYVLEDTNGKTMTIKSKELKNAIVKGVIGVLNLTLTSDNRLVDGANTKLQQSLKKKLTEASKKVQKRPAKKQPATKKPAEQKKPASDTLQLNYITLTKDDVKKIEKAAMYISEGILNTKGSEASLREKFGLIVEICGIDPEIADKFITDLEKHGKINSHIKTMTVNINNRLIGVYAISDDDDNHTLSIYPSTKNTILRLPANSTGLFRDFCKDGYAIEALRVACDFSQVYSAQSMFRDAHAKVIELRSNAKADKLLDMYKMFNQEGLKFACLESVWIEKLGINHVTRTARMFTNPNIGRTGSKPVWCFSSTCSKKDIDLSHVVNSVGMVGNSNIDAETLKKLGMKDDKIKAALNPYFKIDLKLTDADKELTDKLRKHLVNVDAEDSRLTRKANAEVRRQKAEEDDRYTLYELAVQAIRARYSVKPDELPIIHQKFLVRLLSRNLYEKYCQAYNSDKFSKPVDYKNFEKEFGITLAKHCIGNIDLKSLQLMPVRYVVGVGGEKTRLGYNKTSVKSEISKDTRWQTCKFYKQETVIAYQFKNISNKTLKLPYIHANFLGKIDGINFREVEPGETTVITRHDLLLLLIAAKSREFKNGLIQWKSNGVSTDVLKAVPYVSGWSAVDNDMITKIPVGPKGNPSEEIYRYSLLWCNPFEKIRDNRMYEMSVPYITSLPGEFKDTIVDYLNSVEKENNTLDVSKVYIADVGGRPKMGTIKDIFGETKIMIMKSPTNTASNKTSIIVYVPDAVKYLNIDRELVKAKRHSYTSTFYNVLHRLSQNNGAKYLIVCGGYNVEDIDYFMYYGHIGGMNLERFDPHNIKTFNKAFYNSNIGILVIKKNSEIARVLDELSNLDKRTLNIEYTCEKHRNPHGIIKKLVKKRY
jgi:hypothetical protein